MMFKLSDECLPWLDVRGLNVLNLFLCFYFVCLSCFTILIPLNIFR